MARPPVPGQERGETLMVACYFLAVRGSTPGQGASLAQSTSQQDWYWKFNSSKNPLYFYNEVHGTSRYKSVVLKTLVSGVFISVTILSLPYTEYSVIALFSF